MTGVRKWIARAIAICLAMSFCFTAGALAEPAERVALVIGNGDYRNIPQLSNPTNDARLVAQALKSSGFTLVGGDAYLNVDKVTFDRILQKFGTQIIGSNVALFYFAGHGLQVSGSNYLVPTDANPVRSADLDFQTVNADLVLRQMNDSGTKLNIIVLDACRNNPFAGQMRDISRGLATMRAPKGTLIAYATQPGNVARDGADGNSPFSKALARTMVKPGLDIFRLFNEVGVAVDKSTGGNQQPWVSTSPIDGDFYFVSPNGVPGTTTGVAMANPQPNSVLPPPGPGLPIAGTWSGAYHYPNDARKPVQFQMELTNQGRDIAGRIQEPNTFGNPKAPYLYAQVRGNVTEDGKVHFTKTYDGTGGVSHSVEYDGQINYANGTLSGNWHIGSTRGLFAVRKSSQ